MPIQIPTLPRLLSEQILTVFNIGIVICTLIESYVFPFAIIKWMIVVTKYGGLLSFLKVPDIDASPAKSRYNYTLRLSSHSVLEYNTVNKVSHMSFVVESSDLGDEWMQLSYCGQDCHRIPPALGKMYGPKVQYLDLSYNSIETLKGLGQFSRLEDLILDNNKLGDSVAFPYLPGLRTLSINNNQISDLEGLIAKVSEHFPSLSYLSLLSNKACPNQLSDVDKDDGDYQRYSITVTLCGSHKGFCVRPPYDGKTIAKASCLIRRYYVIYKLPSLRFLDSRRISTSERREASTRGQFMSVRRPPDVPTTTPIVSNVPIRPMPVDFASLGKHKGAYGKCQYKYTGKHSEGNRFIVNSDL